jgi:hypothetical protein
MITVGERWNLNIIATGNDIYTDSVEQMQKYNDSIYEIIQKNKGPNWYEHFLQEVNLEWSSQNEIRIQLTKMDEYICQASFLSEVFLLFQNKKGLINCKKNSFTVYLIGQRKSNTTRSLETVAKFTWNGKKIKPVKAKTMELPFTIPQNGIN